MTEHLLTPPPSAPPLKVGLFLPTGHVMHGGATAHWPGFCMGSDFLLQ